MAWWPSPSTTAPTRRSRPPCSTYWTGTGPRPASSSSARARRRTPPWCARLCGAATRSRTTPGPTPPCSPASAPGRCAGNWRARSACWARSPVARPASSAPLWGYAAPCWTRRWPGWACATLPGVRAASTPCTPTRRACCAAYRGAYGPAPSCSCTTAGAPKPRTAAPWCWPCCRACWTRWRRAACARCPCPTPSQPRRTSRARASRARAPNTSRVCIQVSSALSRT